jgi:hypothetical protein
LVAYLVASAIWHEDLSRQAIAIAAIERAASGFRPGVAA